MQLRGRDCHGATKPPAKTKLTDKHAQPQQEETSAAGDDAESSGSAETLETLESSESAVEDNDTATTITSSDESMEDDLNQLTIQTKIFLQLIDTLKSETTTCIGAFDVPFSRHELKLLEAREFVRVPPPFGKLSKCFYISGKVPVVDNPVQKCKCHEDTTTFGSSTRPAPSLACKNAKETGKRNVRCIRKKSKKGKQVPSETFCGEGCHNRMLFISCSDETCSAPRPELCCNREIQRRETKPTEVKYIPGPGFGLIAKEHIQAGQFIIEYVGEVVDDEECERRLTRYRDTGEKHFYMLEIERDVVIDARYRSNNARFINHSCDPNSEAQKWNVGGVVRIGIFARRDIRPDEEVTIDYQFTHFGEEVDCKCGAVSCSGKMGRKRASVADAKDSSGNGKNQDALDIAIDITPPEQVTSLALLKSAQLDVNWLSTYGYNKRRLFCSHGEESKRESSSSDVSAATNGPVTSPVDTSQFDSSMASIQTTLTNDRAGASKSKVTATLKRQSWFSVMKRGKLEQQKQDEKSYICGGISNWTKELRQVSRSHLLVVANSRAKCTRKKRVSLLEARAECFADLVNFAKGKSKWNHRLSNCPAIDEDRIYRFIEHAKSGSRYEGGNCNDLNEDVCHRCGLAGELICCDSCPAAFHLSCANLVLLPPKGVSWFCNECKNPRQARKSRTIEDTSKAVDENVFKRTHAGPIVPSRKRIFHLQTQELTKRKYKKRAHPMDRTFRLLEQMPLPEWNQTE